MIEEDTVYQELVLNLRAGDDVISVIKLNPPYDLLVDLDKVSLGREPPSILELFHSIILVADNYEKACDDFEECLNFQVVDPSYVVL